jgi:RNA polymerase sigma-70 factor (ECF subfamily)
MSDDGVGEDWLADFHEGASAALERFYREHFVTVERAVGRVLRGADRETVVHEVFFRIVSNGELRRRLRGGSPAAWIASVARNHAIDFQRRHRREVLDDSAHAVIPIDQPALDEAADAHLLVERFRNEVLPAKWRPVFEACFVRQLTQRDAAAELGMSRTTLLYQQHRVRALLRRFLLEDA